MTAFELFQEDFKSFAKNHYDILETTLSNIFTMRLIGNKTHGDLAEIGIAEFITQYMDNYDCQHVGKDKYRAKEHEEDIEICCKKTNKHIPVSLKAYGDGPLQLSTDKNFSLYPYLQKLGTKIVGQDIIDFFNSDAFKAIDGVNIMPLIYREDQNECNIMIFNFERMKNDTCEIIYVDKGHQYDKKLKSIVPYKSRKHPIYIFLNKDGEYICEVRYGDAEANALQRGLWTHTRNASQYFNSLTGKWIKYTPNETLVQLFRLALNTTEDIHKTVNDNLLREIDSIKKLW